MNIRFAQTKTEHTEEEVTFPIYSKSKQDDSEEFTRFVKRTSPIHYLEIIIRKGHGFRGHEVCNVERIEETVFLNKEFYLGKGKFKCTKKEFDKALQETKDWIDKRNE